MFRRLAPLLAAPLLALPAASGVAQQVRGAGDDAWTLPGGVIRFSAGGLWSLFNQLYGQQGELVPLAGGFAADTLGVAQIPALLPLQSSVRTLTGSNAVNVSLGKTVVSASGRVQTATFGVDFGLAHWLQIGALVPLVRTRTNLFFNANPTGAQGNVALNPATSDVNAFVTDTTFGNQLLRAATAVQAYCSGSGASTSQCAGGAALASSAHAFGTSVLQVYGNQASPLVPIQQSDVQQAIDARATNLRTQLNSFAAIGGSGVPQVTATGVVAASTPLTAADIQQLIADTTLGIQSDSLRSTDRLHLGDIQLDAKLLLWDSFHGHTDARMHPHGVNERLAVGVGYRLPTGAASPADTFFAASTGTHEAAVGGRGYLDLLLGSHFWTSFVARYDHSMGSDLAVRVPAMPDSAPGIVPVYRRMTVHRQLGNLWEFEATPRWVVNDFLALSAQYLYRRQQQTQYSGSTVTVGPNAQTGGVTVTVDPTTLGTGSAFREQRVGAGITFSNAYAASLRRAPVPFEVSYLHQQTIAGRGGNIPKLFTDQIAVRLYARIFGR